MHKRLQFTFPHIRPPQTPTRLQPALTPYLGNGDRLRTSLIEFLADARGESGGAEVELFLGRVESVGGVSEVEGVGVAFACTSLGSRPTSSF